MNANRLTSRQADYLFAVATRGDLSSPCEIGSNRTLGSLLRRGLVECVTHQRHPDQQRLRLTVSGEDAASDAAAWAKMAREHEAKCEWAVTRAHRL